MSIPLVQENTKDAINTSIIAIKRNIERINNLLGLSGSEEIDTSIFATKEELDALEAALQPVDEVTVDNMQSVTSNAVAESFSYSTTEQKTGGVWIDGKPIYRKVIDCGALPNANVKFVPHNISNFRTIVKIYGIAERIGATLPLPYVTTDAQTNYDVAVFVETNNIGIVNYTNMTDYTKSYVVVEYTKTTD